jgi:hypothetical protein
MTRGRSSMKVKKISMVSKDDTDSLNKMFEQMTGMSNAEPDVIVPKILKIKQRIVKYYKVFNILLNFAEFRSLEDYKSWFDEIQEFITKLASSTDIDLQGNYSSDDINNIQQLKQINEDDLNKIYKDLKENPHIKQIIITCSNLANYKRYIENKDAIDDKFIRREPGLSFTPLSFSNLDLKVLWSLDDISSHGKKFMLSILHHSYTIGYEIYDIVSSPDVDIRKFSAILVESIAKLRKQIPRCDKAFDVIENSVKLLENNFKNYYKSSVEAENPSIIVESFIIDVSTSQSASPTVTTQFRRIVAFLKQRSAGVNDPKVKKLFGMLNNQFSAMDKELGVKTSNAADKYDDLDNPDWSRPDEEKLETIDEEDEEDNNDD